MAAQAVADSQAALQADLQAAAAGLPDTAALQAELDQLHKDSREAAAAAAPKAEGARRACARSTGAMHACSMVAPRVASVLHVLPDSGTAHHALASLATVVACMTPSPSQAPLTSAPCTHLACPR